MSDADLAEASQSADELMSCPCIHAGAGDLHGHAAADRRDLQGGCAGRHRRGPAQGAGRPGLTGLNPCPQAACTYSPWVELPASVHFLMRKALRRPRPVTKTILSTLQDRKQYLAAFNVDMTESVTGCGACSGGAGALAGGADAHRGGATAAGRLQGILPGNPAAGL